MTVKVSAFLNDCEKCTLFKERARPETAEMKFFKSVGGDSLHYHKTNGGMREINIQNLNKIILDYREIEQNFQDAHFKSSLLMYYNWQQIRRSRKAKL